MAIGNRWINPNGFIYSDIRLSNFADTSIEEINAKALVDAGAIDLDISEHLAIQLKLKDLKPREVILANGDRKLVRYVGPKVIPNPESPNIPIFF